MPLQSIQSMCLGFFYVFFYVFFNVSLRLIPEDKRREQR